jgi:hypothetical protein
VEIKPGISALCPIKASVQHQDKILAFSLLLKPGKLLGILHPRIVAEVTTCDKKHVILMYMMSGYGYNCLSQCWLTVTRLARPGV